MIRYMPPVRLFSNKPGLVILLTNFSAEVSLIFLPLFAQGLGASKLQIGLIGAAYGIAYFTSSWFFSRQSDMKGRLPFIRIGLGIGMLALATQALVNSSLTLILARALVGFFLGMSAAALMAYSFETGGGRSISRFAALGSLGWLLGDVVAIFTHNYYILFLLSSASCGVAFIISLSFTEQVRRYSLKPATLQVVRRNLKIYFSFFLRHLGANMVWVILPLFMASLGASKFWIAILLAINAGGQSIIMMFVERIRESRLFIFGFILSAAVFLIYSQSTGYLQLIPVQVLLAAAWSCLYVGALLLLLRKNEEKATATGILFSAVSLSGTVGPFLGGLVAQLWGYSALMYIAAGFSLAGLGLAAMRSR
jgi:MFS family permease